MKFIDVLTEAITTPGLVKEFDRLWGTSISKTVHRKPIEIAIDQATGYDKHLKKKRDKEMQEFVNFVFEFIYIPLIKEGIANRLQREYKT